MEAVAPLVAGIAVISSILAFFAFFGPDDGKSKMKKRAQAAVDNRRAELRAAHLGKDKKSVKAEKQLEMMKGALEKMKMEEMISSTELRMKLASAGWRGREAAVRYLFFQLAGPPVLALGAFLYLNVLLKPVGWGMFEYSGICLIAAGIGYYLPPILVTNAAQKRQQEILRGYPDALDLLTICVEAGMSIEQAFNRVAHEISGQSLALMEEMQLTTAELSFVGDRRQAFENLASRTGLPQVRSIVSAMIQAEKYGTPMGSALRVIAQESRDERMSKAEQKAASLPAKLTVPMMVFFVPVLFIVILGPAILTMMDL
ncbi:MAG: type II secretion system F family protein [Neomegalonema sp.]|nr:type II secretion system F family protein [Neomegalonema sp.]